MKRKELESKVRRLEKLVGMMPEQRPPFITVGFFSDQYPLFPLAEAVQAIADNLGMEFSHTPEMPGKVVLVKKQKTRIPKNRPGGCVVIERGEK